MAKRKPFNSKLVKKDNEDLLTRDLNDFVEQYYLNYLLNLALMVESQLVQ